METVDLLQTIGNNIRTNRRTKDIKQEHLAQMLQLTKGTVSKIENGQMKKLCITRLNKIANALEKDILEFLVKK